MVRVRVRVRVRVWVRVRVRFRFMVMVPFLLWVTFSTCILTYKTIFVNLIIKYSFRNLHKI